VHAVPFDEQRDDVCHVEVSPFNNAADPHATLASPARASASFREVPIGSQSVVTTSTLSDNMAAAIQSFVYLRVRSARRRPNPRLTSLTAKPRVIGTVRGGSSGAPTHTRVNLPGRTKAMIPVTARAVASNSSAFVVRLDITR
jgi:hypothetical protein